MTGGLLPNLLICGAPKSGTSSLHTWLAAHPDALGAAEKETFFFTDPGTHMHRPEDHAGGGFDRYRRHFRPAPGQRPKVVLESTPAYLYAETALREVPGLPTRPKCLFLLREPGAQIHSLFRYFQGNWDWIPAGMDFAAYLAALRRGGERWGGNELARDALVNARYIDFLRHWRDRLGPERMRVESFENLAADPAGLTRDIARWAGLDPAFYDSYAFPRGNETYAVRSRALQGLNIGLRARLPKGAAYRALRAVYRRLNTRRPGRPPAAERALIAALSQDYAEANAALRAEFGLALPGWA